MPLINNIQAIKIINHFNQWKQLLLKYEYVKPGHERILYGRPLKKSPMLFDFIDIQKITMKTK